MTIPAAIVRRPMNSNVTGYIDRLDCRTISGYLIPKPTLGLIYVIYFDTN